MADNSSNNGSMREGENCDEIWEQAWISFHALEILRIECPTQIRILLPHFHSAWSDIEALTAALAARNQNPESPEQMLIAEILEAKEKYTVFLETLSQKKFSSGSRLNNLEQSDLLKQVYSLDKTLNLIKVYLLRAKGWKPWYQRRWIQAALLLIFLWWVFGQVRVWWLRHHRGYEVLSSVQGWGSLQMDKSVAQNSLKVDGHTCISGLGTHADSEIAIRVFGKPGSLEGVCGLDDDIGYPGTIQCEIRQEGQTLFKSEILNEGHRQARFSVPIKPEAQIVLLVNDAGDGNGNDHADWCDLRLR